MDEINKIRKSFFQNGKSKNALAKEFKRSWATINQIVRKDREELQSRGKRPNRKKKVITQEVIKAIESYLDEEVVKKVGKKQTYTALYIYNELKDKKIYKGSKRRMEETVRSLRLKRKQLKVNAFLPLDFPLGSALQVDHGEVDLEIGGVREKGYLFVASVPGQVLRYCQIFPTKASEAWGEFHERTFGFFGGVFPKIVYDNDTVLVKKVTKDGRLQTNFSLSLEEHYGFESHFCNLASGNEKGSVENGVKYCRKRFLAGYPIFASWDEANRLLSSCCKKDIEEGCHYKTKEKLSNLFRELQKKLAPCAPQKKWCRWTDARVDKCQLITVENHQYSVPERFIGSQMRIALTVSQLEVFKEGELVASHQRQYEKKDSLNLDHYLDQLKKKPSSFSYAKAVTQHNFSSDLLEMQRRLMEKYEGKQANRQFISILLLFRNWEEKEVSKGIREALDLGAIDCAAVETILRKKDFSQSTLDQAELNSLMPTSIGTSNLNFDLSCYKDLCEEVAS